ncbi:phosphonate C-P lyase system protein PhnH [Alkalihalobacillus sp. FSL R5-0424]
MQVDMVHDTQRAFRTVLDAMARPGKISRLHNSQNATAMLAYTLLDREVSYHMLPGFNEQLQQTIALHTLAQQTDPSNADFLFISAATPPHHIQEALIEVKNGTLIDPHQSATIIFQTPHITEGTTWRLTGPGIQSTTQLTFHFPPELHQIRQAKNQEYPLGIDLIITDTSGQIAAIPRTTLMEEVL